MQSYVLNRTHIMNRYVYVLYRRLPATKTASQIFGEYYVDKLNLFWIYIDERKKVFVGSSKIRVKQYQIASRHVLLLLLLLVGASLQ